MKIDINLKNETYEIIVEDNSLEKIEKYIDLDRKVLVVTDDNIPKTYWEKVTSKCKNFFLSIIPHGENNKNFDSYLRLQNVLLTNNFSRKDLVIAIGGGMVGDLAGFVSSTYMRGIDFVNIPTTLLSQVDSSIGGKTAIDFNGYKNIIGSFYQPKKVIIDPSVLNTLDNRQMAEGKAEIIKMAAALDNDFFEYLDRNGFNDIKKIIIDSLNIKKIIVEKDEKEDKLRKILNFGHTLGHAIESLNLELYHGECVALGMLPMCNGEVAKRIRDILEREKINLVYPSNLEKIKNALNYDKKKNNNVISAVLVDDIGSAYLKDMSIEEIASRYEKYI